MKFFFSERKVFKIKMLRAILPPEKMFKIVL